MCAFQFIFSVVGLILREYLTTFSLYLTECFDYSNVVNKKILLLISFYDFIIYKTLCY